MGNEARATSHHAGFVTKANMRFGEYLMLSALLTAGAAMAVDIMLPALPAIGKAFGIADENDRQLVILVFIFGFGTGQIVFGPMSDYFGRRPLLIGGLSMMAAMSIIAPFSPTFSFLLAARLIQGWGSSAVRSVVVAAVRDCFHGNEMGRIMSMIFSAFMIVPVAAPLAGQFMLPVVGWEGIFYFLFVLFSLLILWIVLRMGETLAPADRRSLTVTNILSALKEIATHRVAAGYTAAATLTSVGLYSFITLAQQLYGELYHLGAWFPVAFALNAMAMAAGALLSARLVRRFGTRRLAHAAIMLYAVAGIVLSLWSVIAPPPLAATFLCIAAAMTGISVIQGNMGAIALESLGHVAGIASAIFGVLTASIGVALAAFVGQAYDGTVHSIAFAFGITGILALAAVVWTERGRLFR